MMTLHKTLCAFIFTMGCLCLSIASEVTTPKQHTSLEGRMLKKYVFNNASKHWNHYVRKLLHSSLFPLLKNKFLTIYLQGLVKLVEHFFIKSKQVNHWHYKISSFSTGINDEGTSYDPLMTYRFLETTIGVVHYVQIKQHFILHPYLHLNMTVHYIYFSSNSFHQCYFGSLTIWNHTSGYNPYYPEYQYCGIVPSFILYLSFSRIILEISIKSYLVTLDSIITYSVIDSYQIISCKLNNIHSAAPKSVLNFLIPNAFVLRYELVVERYEQLHILSNASQYYFIDVYDGPGTLYNIINPFTFKEEMVQYTTTTFQCVILLFTKNNTFSKMLITYDATVSTNLYKEIYMEKNHSILVTSKELNDTEMKIIKFETQGDLFLKVTILQLNYTGNNHSSCGYAGITSYDIFSNGTFQKISTICHSNNKQEYKYRNMYTGNSKMLLVLYSYKKYSNFSLELLVSISHCKISRINICELKHHVFSKESKIFFPVLKQGCMVLQLDYRYISSFKHFDRSFTFSSIRMRGNVFPLLIA